MKETKAYVYAFLYTDCIYESAYRTMSIHKTAKGAYFAMRKFILDGYNEWREDGIICGKQMFKYGHNEAWCVRKMEILD